MADKIRAIPTRYKNHFMRSRLEARWAVFFDAIGLQWEYEAEGFQFGDSKWLPDFYLPSLDWCIEIKPANYDQIDLDDYLKNIVRLTAFCVETGGNIRRSAFLIFGPPDYDRYEMVGHWTDWPDRDSLSIKFASGRRDENAIYALIGDGTGYSLLTDCSDEEHRCDKWPLADSERMRSAYRAAMSERFEFSGQGEASGK